LASAAAAQNGTTVARNGCTVLSAGDSELRGEIRDAIGSHPQLQQPS
jgi:hypothetical protein